MTAAARLLPVAGRIPPHDLDAEAAVLAAILLERDALDKVLEILRAEHFYAEANRRIYEVAVELSSQGTPIDIVSVAGMLRDRERLAQVGGSAYLAQLVDAVPSVAHIETYAQMVHEKWRVRSLIATCQRVAAEGYGDVGEVQTFIDQAENAIFQLSHTERRQEIAPISEATRESWENVSAAMQRRGKVEFPTGLERVDRKLTARRESLTVLAARPGMGKTGFALGLAIHLANLGLVGAIWSLEMPRADLATRMACQHAELNLDRAMNGFLRRDEEALLASAEDYIARLPLWIDDAPGSTIFHIRAGARRVRAEMGRLDFVIVDYLQLMSTIDDRDSASREQEIATIARGLKRLARELKVPVWALSQLSRKCEERPDKRPMLSDLRESGAIEQDADNVLFLYRPEYYQKEKTPEQDRGVVEIDIAKQRNGPTGRVRARFDGPTISFSNLQIEGDAAPDPQEQFPFTDDTPEASQ